MGFESLARCLEAGTARSGIAGIRRSGQGVQSLVINEDQNNIGLGGKKRGMQECREKERDEWLHGATSV